MEITKQEFVDGVVGLFPDIKDDIVELNELIHLQMDRFRYRVEDEMKKRNGELVLQSFMLAE